MLKLNPNWMHPRDQIIMIIDKIYKGGLTTTSGGNISIIDDNGDVWVTPSAPHSFYKALEKESFALPTKPSLSYGE